MLPKILLVFILSKVAFSCNPVITEYGTACLCEVDDCDIAPSVGMAGNDLKMIFTGKYWPGFSVRDLVFEDEDPTAALITIGEDQFQTIIGFGGALTDSTGVNLKMLDDELRDLILQNYFGSDGIEYTVVRVPIGGTDFSPRHYTLDDHDGDANLEYFALQEEDFEYKIPFIQRALELRGDKQLNLFGSAWTAPLWMKDIPRWHSGTLLQKQYYQTWADYHIKFLDEYAKQNISFWGLTTGNEPYEGHLVYTVPSMGWTTANTATFIKEYFGPTIRNSTHSDIKIMIHDENLDLVPFLAEPLLADDDVLQYVDGVGIHWYNDKTTAEDTRKLAKTEKKDTFVLNTEACHFVTEPALGNWERAAAYIENIITGLQYDYSGWVDWNMVLNITGGPSLIGLSSDALIVIGDNTTQFYKQPMFYAMGVFSKYIYPGSVRLGVEPADDTIKTVAFLREDNRKAVVIYNPNEEIKRVQIKDKDRYSRSIDLEPKSINTVIYENA